MNKLAVGHLVITRNQDWQDYRLEEGYTAHLHKLDLQSISGECGSGYGAIELLGSTRRTLALKPEQWLTGTLGSFSSIAKCPHSTAKTISFMTFV